MRIELEGLGKKFNRDWIFKNLDHVFEEKTSTAIIGNNGSGKSTLLQLISTYSDPTKGQIKYSRDEPSHHISFAAPYLELIEELTLWEHLEFHFQFKKSAISFDEMISLAGLQSAKDKMIADFSSGMKQRLKLILAFFSEDELVLLDEPCSNLDEQGIIWYQKQLSTILPTKTIIIASNQRFEFEQCEKTLAIENYKR